MKQETVTSLHIRWHWASYPHRISDETTTCLARIHTTFPVKRSVVTMSLTPYFRWNNDISPILYLSSVSVDSEHEGPTTSRDGLGRPWSSDLPI